MLTILLKLKTKGWHLWLTFCPWLYVLTVGEAETQCLVSAVISESVVGKREKNAHTLLLSHIHMLRSFHHLDKTTLEHLLFSSIALSPSYYCLTQIDVRHCVAIKSWSVFLTHPAEKIEWLIKKKASLIFCGSWMHQSALMSDSRNHPSARRSLLTVDYVQI